MGKNSSGILAWRKDSGVLKVLLVHPGGPYFTKKDEGAWSIPKGECMVGEGLLQTARREFMEELGIAIEGDFTALALVKQKGGKTVHAWAVEAEPEIKNMRYGTFIMEWPPGTGKMREFPEVDKAEWFTADEAKRKINAAQVAFIYELEGMQMS